MWVARFVLELLHALLRLHLCGEFSSGRARPPQATYTSQDRLRDAVVGLRKNPNDLLSLKGVAGQAVSQADGLVASSSPPPAVWQARDSPGRSSEWTRVTDRWGDGVPPGRPRTPD